MSTLIQQLNAVLPVSNYAYTAEVFFYTNILWSIREVDLACYTMHNEQLQYSVAAPFGQRIFLYCIPMSRERLVAFLTQFIHADDWIDVYLLNGIRIRNVGR